MQNKNEIKQRVCTLCGVQKPLNQFYTYPNRKHDKKYYRSRCKECWAALRREYYLNNTDSEKAMQRQWVEYNRPRKRSLNARRRSKRAKATPDWLTQADIGEIHKIYEDAYELSNMPFVDEPFHVDHIIPLQGKDITGLHVPWNLQILTQTDNLSKGNMFK